MECEEFILPDWSPPDDPARVLAAVGRLNPSQYKKDQMSSKVRELCLSFDLRTKATRPKCFRH